jgi:hypothetical protein
MSLPPIPPPQSHQANRVRKKGSVAERQPPQDRELLAEGQDLNLQRRSSSKPRSDANRHEKEQSKHALGRFVTTFDKINDLNVNEFLGGVVLSGRLGPHNPPASGREPLSQPVERTVHALPAAVSLLWGAMRIGYRA